MSSPLGNKDISFNVKGVEYTATPVEVTPELATRWLEETNSHNRNLKPKHVTRLARAMERGEFHFVGDFIRFSKSGKLLDGQHRLTAIVRSGTTQPMMILEGLPEDAQQYMDANSLRSNGDQVKLQLGVGQPLVWASISRLLIRADAEDLLTDILSPSAPEVVDFVRENRDPLGRAVKAASATYTAVGGSQAVGGAAYFLAEAKDPVTAIGFWKTLASGENIAKGSPIYALREAILRRRKVQRWTPNEELAAYARCWNATRKGERIEKLNITRGSMTIVDNLTFR